MKIIRESSEPTGPTVVTVGVFDGVHIGHLDVLQNVRRIASKRGAASCVVTFDVHPAEILRPGNAPKLLTTLEQKLELIEKQGIDYTYVLRFDELCAEMLPEDFIKQLLVDALHAEAVVVGEDFRFGKGRAGNVADLQRLGLMHGFDVTPLKLVSHASSGVVGGVVRELASGVGVPASDARELVSLPVSSTSIRRFLANGDVAKAAAMLGRLYEVRGTVVEGDKRGALTGFRTANVPVPKIMAWPVEGVYAGYCRFPTTDYRFPATATKDTEDTAMKACAINIGRRPTFYEYTEQLLMEVHILDFDGELCGCDGELYGCEIKVEFIDFLRGEQKFQGIEELRQQLKIDVAKAQEICSFTERVRT